MKLFEWIGSLMAVLCLAKVAHNPRQPVEDIRRGPLPCLSCLNESLPRRKRPVSRRLRTSGPQKGPGLRAWPKLLEKHW